MFKLKSRYPLRLHRNRLAFFRPIEDMHSYWESHWKDPVRRARLISQAQTGDLGEFGPIIKRYVPRDLPVLEAGCGLGQVVVVLEKWDYEAIGIDYEAEVVRFVNQEYPHLDVRMGDVRSLDLPSGSIGCYLSLGVLEHFEEGLDVAMAEARRVLHRRGVALISVPYINPIRHENLKIVLSNGTAQQTDLTFYQYYFSDEEFSSLLANAGLKAIDQYPLFPYHMLVHEHPVFYWYWRSSFCRHRMKQPIRRVLKNLPRWLKKRYAHMMMYVCRPIG